MTIAQTLNFKVFGVACLTILNCKSLNSLTRAQFACYLVDWDFFNEIYILSGPSMKHARQEGHSSLSHSGLYWGIIYLCGKNDVICYTQSVLIRNGPITNTSEIFGFFKKLLVKFSKLRNPTRQFSQSKKHQTFCTYVSAVREPSQITFAIRGG